MSTGLAHILNFIDNICETYERNEIKDGEEPSENVQGIRNIRRVLNIRNINRDYDNNRFILSNIFNQNNNREENPIANIVGSVITNYINNINNMNQDNKDNKDNNITVCLYSDLEESKKGDDNCSICFEKLSEDIIGITSCNHIYHHKCISEWVNNSKSCPLCRTSI